MANKSNFDLDAALLQALHEPQAGGSPAPELDAQLKARLWQRQEELDRQPDTRAVSLWWLPMVANFIVCGVPAVIFSLPIMPLWAHLAALALAWMAVGGVVLTLIGLKMSNLKESTTILLPKKHKRRSSAC